MMETNSVLSNRGGAPLSADGIVDLFTGTPDGTKFLRDDGTLAPAGGDLTDPTITGTITLEGDGLSDTTKNQIVTNGNTITIQTKDDSVAWDQHIKLKSQLTDTGVDYTDVYTSELKVDGDYSDTTITSSYVSSLNGTFEGILSVNAGSLEVTVTEPGASGAIRLLSGNGDGPSLEIAGSSDFSVGISCGNIAAFRVVGKSYPQQAGMVALQASMFTRTINTAYNLIYLDKNACGEILLIDNVMTGNAVTRVIIKNGAIVAIVGDTATYVTTLTSGAQMALTTSGGSNGGYLVGTTSSTYTRKLGVNANGLAVEGL